MTWCKKVICWLSALCFTAGSLTVGVNAEEFAEETETMGILQPMLSMTVWGDKSAGMCSAMVDF